MNRLEKPSFNGSSTRSLRAINILAFIPGIILLLASGLVTAVGSVSFVAVLPLTLSALLGLKSVTGRKDKSPMPWTTCADLFIAMFLVSILIPLYVALSGLAIDYAHKRFTFRLELTNFLPSTSDGLSWQHGRISGAYLKFWYVLIARCR
jgi:hypothetical protein